MNTCDDLQEMTIYLQGLCCANCAGKIETAVNRMSETEKAEINLVKQEMRLSLHPNTDQEKLFTKIKDTVHRYEADVVVSLKKAEHPSHCCCCHDHEGGCYHDHEAHEHHHSHTKSSLKQQILRFGVGIVFFLCGASFTGTISTACFLIAYLFFGADVIYRALRNISKGQIFDENFLMSISTIGAMALGEMSEAVFVMLFYQVGEAFQEYAVNRSRHSITALMEFRPDTAHLKLADGSIQTVPPEQVAVGDIIQVQTGEKIPLDGIVRSGSAMLDTSALTGESLPRHATTGVSVLSGCINTDGLLQIEVTKPFAQSTVSKILELVENAAGNKSKAEKFITRFARVYTPIVVGLAVLLSIVPPLLGMGAFSHWFGRALIFLVVSCPCALVLSVPLTYFSGIGAASKNGILIKGGNDLDTLCHTNCMVFDKTGTLTKGHFSVTQINGENQDTLLAYAAAAESLSSHPIAAAIQNAYGKEITSPVTEYQEKGGFGITCTYEGKSLAVGNARLMQECHIDVPAHTTTGSVVYVAADGIYQGMLVVEDALKDGCALALQHLRKYGIQRMVMLTGDRKENAEAIAAQIGIDEVSAELLPWDKAEHLSHILQQQTTGKTAFIGDGINDAPVLAAADVGIAMGGIGSDAAIEAADIVLMDDQLEKLAIGMRIAKNTRKLVIQNITFALGIKIAVMILGAIGMANMWMAVFADVGVAVLAVLNAMRKK